MKQSPTTGPQRRDFLRFTAGAGLLTLLPHRLPTTTAAEMMRRSFTGQVGITTGGGLGKKRECGELNLVSLPDYVRNELGMSLIDVNSLWLESYEAEYLQLVRTAAEEAECVLTNLKVNHSFGDLYSEDPDERRKALTEGKYLVDVAKMLGTQWIRFGITKAALANPTAHRELASYAERQDIQLLVENSGWLAKDANSIVSVVKAIGSNVAPCPDIGNWDDGVREQGLRNSFPGAASCDFKVFEMTAEGQHPRYDLKSCFDIGWQAGFRGPWVIENMHDSGEDFARHTMQIRSQLQKWIATAKAE